MSTKKRFSIAPDLANGIRNTIQSASTNSGQLHYDMMSVNVIEPDPHNPRSLSITRDDIRQGNIKNALALKDFEAIKELAESIKRIGIRNAIEVYKDGEKYRIICGERRYLAAILAGQDYVPARISQKPDEFKLRYIQWVENINREDLSLFDKYNNLQAMATAYDKSAGVSITAQKLIEILGVSSTHAYRYFALMNASADVIALVQQGKLTNLKVIEELAAIKDPERRAALLDSIRDEERALVSLSKYKDLVSQSTKKKAAALANLKVPHSAFARTLYELILASPELADYQTKWRHQHIDWSSSRAVTQAFKKLFSTIEKACCVEENMA